MHTQCSASAQEVSKERYSSKWSTTADAGPAYKPPPQDPTEQQVGPRNKRQKKKLFKTLAKIDGWHDIKLLDAMPEHLIPLVPRGKFGFMRRNKPVFELTRADDPLDCPLTVVECIVRMAKLGALPDQVWTYFGTHVERRLFGKGTLLQIASEKKNPDMHGVDGPDALVAMVHFMDDKFSTLATDVTDYDDVKKTIEEYFVYTAEEAVKRGEKDAVGAVDKALMAEMQEKMAGMSVDGFNMDGMLKDVEAIEAKITALQKENAKFHWTATLFSL